MPHSSIPASETTRAQPLPTPGPDLVSLDAVWSTNGGAFVSPAIVTGDLVRFRTQVQNIGGAVMPAGLITDPPSGKQLDVAWLIDGAIVNVSDQDEASLGIGATRTLTATGGGPGGVDYWIATTGSHSLQAWVNSQARKVETNYLNNTFTRTITVSSASARRPIYSWIGITDMDRLLFRTPGFGFQEMKDSGYDGHVISTGGGWPFPAWMINELAQTAAFGDVYVGMNVCRFGAGYPPRTQAEWDSLRGEAQHLATSAIEAGARGTAIDPEPYGVGSPQAWDQDKTLAHTNGLAIGAIFAGVGDGTIQFYMSSDSSWAGSNEWGILNQVYGPNANYSPFHPWYVDSCFPNFVHGLIEAGCTPNLLDASFHLGIQRAAAGGNWDTAIDLVVQGVEAEFPSGAQGDAMIWPTENISSSPPHEKSGFEIQTAVRAATTRGSGALSIYGQIMTDGTKTAYWTGTVFPNVLIGKTT